MKSFLKTLVLFLIPIFLILGVIEFAVWGIPNSYSLKYNYIKNNGERIQVIAVGHSQFYDGFKPDEFHIPAFNCSNSAQSYMDDYYILKEILPLMPNVKTVFLPIGYLDVGTLNGNTGGITSKCAYYHKYMHVDYDGQMPMRYWFESFDPVKAIKKIIAYYIDHEDMVKCDSLGYRNYGAPNEPTKLVNTGLSKVYTLSESDYNNFCIKDEYYLIAAIELLKANDINVILVSPPYYWSEFDNINPVQKEFLKNYIFDLKKKYSLIHVNMEEDDSFTEEDFHDEAHLAYYGAVKFSKILDGIVVVGN